MNRFLKGVTYIEDHLGEDFTLGQVAKAAHLSPHHFARSFRAISGDTVMGYVRKRRLSIAAERLVRQAIPIMELALDAGFDSQEAFTRAFKRQFNITPGAFREKQKAEWVRYRSPLTADILSHIKENNLMEPVIKDYPAFKVVGLAKVFDMETRADIPKLWEQLVPRFGEIKHASTGVTYGLCQRVDQPGAFKYMACMEVDSLDDLPEGMEGIGVPAHKYAVFTHTISSGNLHEDLKPTMEYIWGTWAETSDFTYSDAPDFERCPPDFDPTRIGQTMEIFVPVE